MRQDARGWRTFSIRDAGALQAELTQQKHVLETKLKETFGSWYAPVSPDPTKALFVPKRDNKKLGYVAGQQSTKIKLVEFSPGSRMHIERVLRLQGWKPTKLTEGGRAQIDEETIEGIVARYPAMSGLGEFMLIEKRLSQLAGTDNSLIQSVQDDGRIHGAMNTMGTATSRATHFYPNMSQVPSAKKPYGSAFRSLFAAPSYWLCLGADLQGLELRALAHYLAPLDGGAYGRVVLDGDVHWENVKAMGLATGERDKHNQLHTIVREDGAKRFIYAYLYGAGEEKCGTIIYECALNARRNAGADGEALYREFFGNNPTPNTDAIKRVGRKVRGDFLTKIAGFKALQNRIAAQVKRKGCVPGLDGRRIPVRSEHSALNFLLQSCGAILSKEWVASSYETAAKRFGIGWAHDAVLWGWFHDEQQWCVKEGLEKDIGEIIVKASRMAGEKCGFRVPLDSEYAVGASWNATH